MSVLAVVEEHMWLGADALNGVHPVLLHVPCVCCLQSSL